jgi:hypothetical protein
MNTVDIQGWNVTLAEEQPEYSALRGLAQLHTRSIHDTSKEEYDSGPSITVAFKPEPEELVSLLNGGTVYLRVLGTRFPPVALWVE